MSFKTMLRCLLIGLAAMTVSIPGQAAMVGTAQLQADSKLVDLGELSEQRDWIREQLVIGGVGESLAAERVAAMTDAQVEEVFERIDAAPAGGNTLAIVLIVLIVLEVLGYTDFIKD